MLDILKNNWFQLTIGGILMVTISTFLFGGVIYNLVINPASWIYIAFLAFSGASTMVIGILMLFDAATQRVEKQLKKGIKQQEGDFSQETKKRLREEEQEYIQSLIQRSEKLRPENLKKNRSA